jgi:hypothetical protein
MACGQTGDYFSVALLRFQSLGKFFQQGTVQRTRSMANVNCFVANWGGEETRVAAGALGTRGAIGGTGEVDCRHNSICRTIFRKRRKLLLVDLLKRFRA